MIRLMQPLAVLALPLAIAACGGGETETKAAATAAAVTPSTLTSSPWRHESAPDVESAELLTDERFGERLVASEQRGLLLFAADGSLKSQLPGAFGAIDVRAGDSTLLVAAVDLAAQLAVMTTVSPDGEWRAPIALPRRDFKIDGLCLQRDGDSDYLFLVGEEGIGEQWLVARRGEPVAAAKRVRGLSLPPASEYCRVDDAAAQLFVNEERVGLWVYAAGAEADLQRAPVALRQPFGDVAQSVTGMALVPGGVLLLDAEASALHRYRRDGDNWSAEPVLTLAGVSEPESLSVRVAGDTLQLLLRDDDGLHAAELNWIPPSPPTIPPIAELAARVQTDPVPSLGDAADDPAIWLHPTLPQQSRIVTADKRGGVIVYDLAGRQLQDLRVGRINNIDLRSEFRLGGELIDLAVGSNRDRNALQVLAIDRSSGELRNLGEIDTPLDAIYGLCLFKDRNGSIFAFANDKDGRFVQYQLDGGSGSVRGALVRRFALQSQPEGCVADDAEQRLFVGEEDVAVWTLDARADAPTDMTQLVAAGNGVEADIEGLAIYRGSAASYLVVSSQGDDSYVLFDALPPFARRGAFRIGADANAGIDGVSETDGLEVTAANLGGPWSRGLLVVQDGRKRMPEGNQNYKLVAWSDIAALLGLD